MAKKKVELFTIKLGLDSFLRNYPVLFEKIQLDVLEMSQFARETSIYIQYYYLRRYQNMKNKETYAKLFEKKPKFLHFFYHLKDKSSPKKFQIDPEYNKLRKTYSLPLYDGSNRGHLFVSLANLYETIFQKNVTAHMYARVLEFFHRFYPVTDASEPKQNFYETLNTMFNSRSTRKANPQHLLFWREQFPSITNFHDLRKKWFHYIPFLIELQEKFVTVCQKPFTVFPTFRAGRLHVHYDTFALFQLLSSVKLLPKGVSSYPEFLPQNQECWSKFFNFQRVETKQHKYAHSFTTDGVSVCLHMKRVLEVQSSTKNQRQSKNCLGNGNLDKVLCENLQSGKYSHLIGLDPGLRLTFGGTIRDLRNNTFENIKLSSKSLRHMSGEFQRKRQFKKWTAQILEESKSPVSSKILAEFVLWTEHALSFLSRLNTILGQRKIARLKFQKYISTEKTAAEIVKGLLKNKEAALVFIGSTEISNHKGNHLSVFQKKIYEHLKRKSDTRLTDEFRSTMLCSKCFNFCLTSKRPHRYQVCPNCNITWNRDINAGNNIITLGLCELLNLEKPDNFSKNKKTFDV